jgi:hypothetical protein
VNRTEEAFERAVALFVQAIVEGEMEVADRFAALAFGLARLAEGGLAWSR